MTHLFYEARDEADTQRLGTALSNVLPSGSVVALMGTLGAGKTRLVQAVAKASGVTDQNVVSPTFVLLQQYQGRRPICHFDAYRLRDEEEFLDLGPEEYFDAAGLTFIEWADRVQACLPANRLEIRIEITGPDSRRFEIRGQSCLHASVLEQLRAAVGVQ